MPTRASAPPRPSGGSGCSGDTSPRDGPGWSVSSRCRRRPLLAQYGPALAPRRHHYWQNDYPSTRAAYEEAVAIAREVGDPRLLASALLDLVHPELGARSGPFRSDPPKDWPEPRRRVIESSPQIS